MVSEARCACALSTIYICLKVYNTVDKNNDICYIHISDEPMIVQYSVQNGSWRMRIVPYTWKVNGNW